MNLRTGEVAGIEIAGSATAFPSDADPAFAPLTNAEGWRALFGEGWIDELESRGWNEQHPETSWGVRRREWWGGPRKLGQDAEGGAEALARIAAERALTDAGVEAGELDLVIASTSTPGHISASLAHRVGRAIGAEAAGIDVRVGGAGALAGWTTAALHLAHGARLALVVAADVPSVYCGAEEPELAMLYGDGGGAVLLRAGEGVRGGLLAAVSGGLAYAGRPFTVPGPWPPRGGVRYVFQKPDATYRGELRSAWDEVSESLRALASTPPDHFLPYGVTREQIERAASIVGVPAPIAGEVLAEHGCTGCASPLICLHELRASGAGELGGAWLFATGRAEENSIPPHGHGPRLVFHWRESAARAWADRLAGGATEQHIVKLGGAKELSVTPGKSYELASGGSFVVVRAFKDFMFDTNTRKAAERSNKPNNPALEVKLRDAQGKEVGHKFLFASFPDFHGSEKKGPGDSMSYAYRGGESARAEEWVAVGEKKELWRLEDAKVAETKPLAVGTSFSLGEQAFVVKALHRSVRASKKDLSRSDEPKNPVVLLELPGGKQRYLGPGNSVRLGASLVLRLFKQEEPKDFISTLAAEVPGMPVVRKRIEVNDPLEVAGLSLYQSDYDPRDLTLSGFQVVRDPGLWLAYGGLLVTLLGVIFVVVAGSPLHTRRRAVAGDVGDSKENEEADNV